MTACIAQASKGHKLPGLNTMLLSCQNHVQLCIRRNRLNLQ